MTQCTRSDALRDKIFVRSDEGTMSVHKKVIFFFPAVLCVEVFLLLFFAFFFFNQNCLNQSCITESKEMPFSNTAPQPGWSLKLTIVKAGYYSSV